MNLRKTFLTCLSVIAFLSGASAADWPQKPVKIVVTFGAGGQSDVVARLLAQVYGEHFKQQFYVENVPGAGGAKATALVKRADADGYTLMISGMSSHVLAPALNTKIEYDPLKDFTHIAYIGGSPSVFVVHPSADVKTFEEFMTWAKASPKGVQYVSPGVGSGGNIVAEFFASKAGIKLEHVPYRGGSGAVTDLLAGHVKMGSITWSTARPHIQSGKLIPIAVSLGQRVAGLPNVPTFKEKGYPDVVTTVWLGLSAPAGVPKDIVAKLNEQTNKALAMPNIKKHLEQDSFDINLMNPDETTAVFKREYEKWVPAVRKALDIK